MEQKKISKCHTLALTPKVAAPQVLALDQAAQEVRLSMRQSLKSLGLTLIAMGDGDVPKFGAGLFSTIDLGSFLA